MVKYIELTINSVRNYPQTRIQLKDKLLAENYPDLRRVVHHSKLLVMAEDILLVQLVQLLPIQNQIL